MAVDIKEICALLNKHAETVCPDLELTFKPMTEDGSVAMAEGRVSNLIAFFAKEVTDAKGPHEFHELFKAKIEKAYLAISETAMDVKIK